MFPISAKRLTEVNQMSIIENFIECGPNINLFNLIISQDFNQKDYIKLTLPLDVNINLPHCSLTCPFGIYLLLKMAFICVKDLHVLIYHNESFCIHYI